MTVVPVSDNTGLPTGAPAVTANVLQTIDFAFTGSIDEIGKNGASSFEGIISDVLLFISGDVIRSYAIDNNSDSIKDSVGGFDGTVINGNNTDWSFFFKIDTGWIGEELVANGGFDADSDWTLGADVTISGGLLNFSNTGNNARQVLTSDITVRGVFTILNYVSGEVVLRPIAATPMFRSSNGTFTEDFVMINETIEVDGNGGIPFTGSVDNVSIKELLKEAP